ncbi:Flp family type IVb pilin [Hoeflea sp.]|uniref:Flp family type IVb pilin n=1 Tax=Hoeflea sp. TaxID=1940281 RepID=UPI003747CF90
MTKELCTRAATHRAGATSIEYGLIAVVLSFSVFGGVGLIGQSLYASSVKSGLSIETAAQTHTGTKSASIGSEPGMFEIETAGSLAQTR